MKPELLKLITQATVRIVLTGGRKPVFTGKGVLLNDGFILTAEACVLYDSQALTFFAEGWDFTLNVVTARGVTLPTTPWMIDPVSGIALLGPHDVEGWPQEAVELEDFILKTIPFPLFRRRLSEDPLSIRIQNRRGIWITGHVTRQSRWPHRVLLTISEKVDNLVLGAPVLTEEGELFGVLQRIVDDREDPLGCFAYMAVAHLALPRWATHQNYKLRYKRCLRHLYPDIPDYSSPVD